MADAKRLPPEIAALYVDRNGIYSELAGVDPWPEDRDARTYTGPWPVVCHPPCETWGRWWWRTGRGRGEDGGCFAAALQATRRWGGVIEHPAASAAWSVYGLAPPAAAGGWTRSLFDPGWTAHVEQGHYGHEAPKPTWLYYVGPTPPPLVWGASSARGRVTSMPGDGRRRRATPRRFAEVLVQLARRAGPGGPLDPRDAECSGLSGTLVSPKPIRVVE